MGKERLDFPFAVFEIVSALHGVEFDIPSDPVAVGPFRVDRVMMKAHKVPHLFQQSGFFVFILLGIEFQFAPCKLAKFPNIGERRKS